MNDQEIEECRQCPVCQLEFEAYFDWAESDDAIAGKAELSTWDNVATVRCTYTPVGKYKFDLFSVAVKGKKRFRLMALDREEVHGLITGEGEE